MEVNFLKFLIKTIVFALVIVGVLQPKAFGKQSDPIEMLAGLSKPPFVIANEDKGMQLEIIEAAFAKSDKVVRFTYIPLSRHLDVFHSREFDGIITLAEHEKEWGICLSKPYIIYQNVVVTLADSAFKINDIEDLANLRVAAFQNATKFIDGNFSATFKNSPSYTEIADQKSQIGLLFSGRVDAVVMDINIFKHLLANERQKDSSSKIFDKKADIHFLFSPRIYKAGFKSKQLCQQFDQGINTIIADGSYQKIIDSYLNPQQH
jgi:polar amino acid transport system substrate-binding protein